MSWSLLSSSQSTDNYFARPLSQSELSFYHDRRFNGTADILWHYTVQQTKSALTPAALFSGENVQRTWSALKQWYPLLGAHIDDSEGVDAVKFVVSQWSMSHLHPDEVVLRTVPSAVEVEATIRSLSIENPTQDHHLIARILIFSRMDSPGIHHILFRVSHMIADGISGPTIARTFLDLLASIPAHIPPLEDRLAMARPYVELNPARKTSVAQQRWRNATGKIIFSRRRGMLAGGHTLPRTVTDSTYRTPAITGRVSHRFSVLDSNTLVTACRMHGVTMGSVIPVISQLAITRMLHRRYLRGEIPPEEWEHRRRQPMHFGGPINLRPYMDKEWQERGGATEVQLAIDYYECTLPFMPTPYGMRRDEGVPRSVDGAPPYLVLMSHKRFFYRARLFRNQLRKVVQSPLILEIAAARQPFNVLRKKIAVEHWLAKKRGTPMPNMVVTDNTPTDFVPANGLSSVGQMSIVLPEKYPLSLGHPLSVRTPHPAGSDIRTVSTASRSRFKTPVTSSLSDRDTLLRILDARTILHSRPFECFLGNATEMGHFWLELTYDANVFKPEDAGEFIDECRQAMMHYLVVSKVKQARL